MTAISLTLVLLYLLGLERAGKKQNISKEILQYREQTGCYVFDL
jgi:hypothetical protein